MKPLKTKAALLRSLEVEALQPVPKPTTPALDGIGNLRALADALGPKEWALHLKQLRREGYWSLLSRCEEEDVA